MLTPGPSRPNLPVPILLALHGPNLELSATLAARGLLDSCRGREGRRLDRRLGRGALQRLGSQPGGERALGDIDMERRGGLGWRAVEGLLLHPHGDLAGGVGGADARSKDSGLGVLVVAELQQGRLGAAGVALARRDPLRPARRVLRLRKLDADLVVSVVVGFGAASPLGQRCGPVALLLLEMLDLAEEFEVDVDGRGEGG
mmetsp:Transcript_52341/g.124674  ORF Transcript_52341/g.124674 Transcript_52341/m.124674 type:complete len:201 (+) Transcript_52341:46-648(+)